jgi:hypothetical protein
MVPLEKGVVIMMYPNSCRFLSQKGVFILFAIIAFILVSFVPLVLAEEQTDKPEAGVPAKEAEGDEHPVSAPGGFMAPTLEGPWRTIIALSAWAPTTLTFDVNGEKINKGLSWLLDKLDWEIPIEGEVRKGSFGAYAHLLAFKLDGELDVGPASFDWNDEGFLLDVGLSYQLGRWALGTGARAPSLTVEPFAGARLLYDPVDIDIDLGPLEDPTTVDISNYVPVIGLRTFWDLTEHWNLRLDGDYGGFGVDDNHETWNLRGLIGYRFRGWGVGWNIQAGYRRMRLMDLRKDGVDLKIDAYGPIGLFAIEF